MALMKTITVRWPDGHEMIYATNPSGEGAFVRHPYEGAYRQITGNAQTPVFKTPQQFRRWLGNLNGGRMVEIGIGWDD